MSIWKKGVIPGQSRRFALGIWLPYRKLASPAYVPSPRARLGTRYKRPIWYVMTLTLGAQKTDYARISVAPNFKLMMILSSSSAASPADGNGPFQFQLYDNARRYAFSELPIAQGVGSGIGSEPFILKTPYSFSGTTPVQARIQNRATGTNTIYLVLYGVSD